MGYTSYIMIEMNVIHIFPSAQKLLKQKHSIPKNVWGLNAKQYWSKSKELIDNRNALIEAKHIIYLKKRQQMQKLQTLLK
jgi:tyrosine-protein phosphatase YwqE